MKIVRADQPATIQTARRVLAEGGLVIFPTETCYGIGADATNQAAVDKLLEYKARREGKPLSIAVTDIEMAREFVAVNESAENIYQRLLPGPITVVSKSLGKVAEGVASEFGTLGVRIPDYDLVGELVSSLGRPITATSANSSGKKTPYTVDDILANISDKQRELIDLIIDAGELPHNPPSTVIDTTLSTPVTMRQGSIAFADAATTTLTSTSEQETKDIAGKLLLKHWNQVSERGLVIGLNGPLGAGKTMFAKGVADFLQITDPLSSPTYTYIEEYPFTRHQTSGTLYHLDVWKVDSAELLDRLEISKLQQPNTILLIEWWENVATFTELQPDLLVAIEETPDHQRTITTYEPA